MTNFILLSGQARHGKDTAGGYFKNELDAKGYKSVIVHYADLLKHICSTFFGWNGEKDEAGRSLLQRVGTDCVRAQHPNYWVDFIISLSTMFPEEYDYIIIPDTRFPNEISRIREAGFRVAHVRVVRKDFENELTLEQRSHASETALDKMEPDYWLYNRSLEFLRKDVHTLCETIVSAFAE